MCNKQMNVLTTGKLRGSLFYCESWVFLVTALVKVYDIFKQAFIAHYVRHRRPIHLFSPCTFYRFRHKLDHRGDRYLARRINLIT